MPYFSLEDILTGSSQFELISSITQSLAGRASLLTLLPFSLAELQAVGRAPESVNVLLLQGLYPPIYDRPVEPTAWLQDYVATYLERDVRQVLHIQDLGAFQRFVQLCAGYPCCKRGTPSTLCVRGRSTSPNG